VQVFEGGVDIAEDPLSSSPANNGNTLEKSLYGAVPPPTRWKKFGATAW
jgi:hypothetical protein